MSHACDVSACPCPVPGSVHLRGLAQGWPWAPSALQAYRHRKALQCSKSLELHEAMWLAETRAPRTGAQLLTFTLPVTSRGRSSPVLFCRLQKILCPVGAGDTLQHQRDEALFAAHGTVLKDRCRVQP